MFAILNGQVLPCSGPQASPPYFRFLKMLNKDRMANWPFGYNRAATLSQLRELTTR